MRSRFVPVTSLKVVLLILAVCLAGGASLTPARGRSRSRQSTYAALARAPEKARVKHNPFQDDPEARLAGKKLFEEHCAECHGHEAEGGRRAPSLRVREVQNAPPGAIFWILSNGVVRRGMPDWSKLPGPERWQIVTFVESLKRSKIRKPPPVPNFPDQILQEYTNQGGR